MQSSLITCGLISANHTVPGGDEIFNCGVRHRDVDVIFFSNIYIFKKTKLQFTQFLKGNYLIFK